MVQIEMIIVTPCKLSQEMISYYHKICQLGNIINSQERLHFIYPENAHKFPKYFSLSRLLYYSPKALNQIKSIIRGKNGYIVPGKISSEETIIGSLIDLPILSGPLDEITKLDSKSEQKQLFIESQLPISPWINNILSQDDIFNKLTVLIAKYPQVSKWVFKVDGEFRGRGIATFDVNGIKALKDMKKQIHIGSLIQQYQVEIIRKIVTQLLPQKLKIATPSLFQSYEEFIEYFLEFSGIIEGQPAKNQSQISSPSIFFYLDPDGRHQVISSYDKIAGEDYVNFGCSFPQQSLPQLNLTSICQSLAQSLHKRKIFGYVTLDLIAFPDISDPLSHPLFYAVGIDCFLSDLSSSFFLFDVLMKGKYYTWKGDNKILPDNFDEIENNPEKSEQSSFISDFQQHSYIFIPYIFHPKLNTFSLNNFFQQCRKDKISFDIETKAGSVFTIVDKLQNGVLGLMGIGESQAQCIVKINESLNFLLLLGQVQRANLLNKHQRKDLVFFMDIVEKVRKMNKQNHKLLFPLFQTLPPQQY